MSGPTLADCISFWIEERYPGKSVVVHDWDPAQLIANHRPVAYIFKDSVWVFSVPDLAAVHTNPRRTVTPIEAADPELFAKLESFINQYL